MKKKILGSVIFWLFSSVVIAGEWSGWSTVDRVYIHDAGSILARFGVMENPEGCNSASWAQVKSDNNAKKEIYSTLVAALASGKEARYYLSGCSGSHPKILHVMVRREPD